jgi:hypothetical protein
MKENKTCSKCEEEKPATAEFFHKAGKGFRGDCKICVAEYAKQHYQVNSEIIKQQSKEYYYDNQKIIAKRREEERQKRNLNQPACIYQIINNQNGQIYVGETMRGKLRLAKHLTELRGNYHSNPNLQEDFNKFGEEAFEWSIIKELPKDREVLTKEEKLHIDSLIAEGKNLYNIKSLIT